MGFYCKPTQVSATISVLSNFLFSTVKSVAHLTWKVYWGFRIFLPSPFKFLNILFSVLRGISCTALQTTLISKRFLLSNILQKTLKTSIWVSITIPSPPHKFMKVFYQEVRVCITLHFFELFFCCRPIAFHVLRVYPSDRIDEMQGLIDCSMIQTQLSLYLAICYPLVGVQNWTGLYLSLYNAQKSGLITSPYEL